MAQDRNETTLGGGVLKLNNVDVGFLGETTSLVYTGESVDFTPSNKQGSVRRFKASEACQLTSNFAQISSAAMRLALGHSTAVLASSSFPSYDPSGYVAVAGNSYDVVNFGGDKSVSEVSLQFVHTMPIDANSKTFDIVVVLYQVVSNFNFNLPFNRTTQTFYDVVFDAQIMPERTAGDQMGFIARQVMAT